MKFGLMTFPTDYSIAPDELGRLAEQHGFESLFFPEHTHIPASRETPYPGGGELPREYSYTLDQFVALTAAALATERLRVATGICLVPQHEPIALAKQVATLDRLSGGRLLFGIGAGWNLEELRSHGTDPGQRFGVMRERVEAMKAIWTQDEASYSGSHVEFERIWSWPKPVAQPHPPILVGGNGERVLERVVRYGDEWMPNRVGDVEQLIARVEELQRLAQEAGRDRIPVTLYAATRDRDRLARLEEAGVHRCVFGLPSAEREEIERLLEQHAATVESLSAG